MCGPQGETVPANGPLLLDHRMHGHRRFQSEGTVGFGCGSRGGVGRGWLMKGGVICRSGLVWSVSGGSG